MSYRVVGVTDQDAGPPKLGATSQEPVAWRSFPTMFHASGSRHFRLPTCTIDDAQLL